MRKASGEAILVRPAAGGSGRARRDGRLWICDVASTANAASRSGVGATMDGVVLVAGDFVLLKNQSAATQNGVYQVCAGTWYFIGQVDVVFVKAGDTNKKKCFLLTSANTYEEAGGTTYLQATAAHATYKTTSADGITITTGQYLLILGNTHVGLWKYNGSTFESAGKPLSVPVQQGVTYGRMTWYLNAGGTAYEAPHAVYK